MSMVSIIIPVYNAKYTLDRSVRSAVCQTYPHIEILLVDDGSTDGSSRICDEWGGRDGRIRVLHKENGGVSSARNMGLEAAHGDYVMMLDSDDHLCPNACERLMEYERRTDADCIIFGYSGDNLIAPSATTYHQNTDSFMRDFASLLNAELISPSWNKLYKRTLLRNGFPAGVSFGEDLIFVLSYLKRCTQIQLVPDALYIYDTSTPCSLSRSVRIGKIHDIESVQTAILNFVGRDGSHPELYRKYVSDALNYVRELYCSDTISYMEKKQLLQHWYPHSYLKDIRYTYDGSTFYKALLFCVRHGLWRVPDMILHAARLLKKTRHRHG